MMVRIAVPPTLRRWRVANLEAAMREQLAASGMQPASKRQALAKLDALRVEVGYPSTWRSYEDVTISRATFFENVRAPWASGQRAELRRLGDFS